MTTQNKISHSIMCGVYACRYLQKNKNFDLVDKVLNSKPSIVKHAKNAGLYSALTSLFSKQIENTESENYYWNIYNYTHCLAILGEYKKANIVLSNISLDDIGNYDCKIGILRLKGEIKLKFSKPDCVLKYVLEEYNKYKNNIVLNATNNQIEMFIVRLLIDEGEYKQAAEMCNRIIDESKDVVDNRQRISKYNIAVASTYLVKIKQLTDQPVSNAELEEIKNSFIELSDTRGYSWILGIEGELLLKSNNLKAIEYIKKSIINRRAMCESSLEYITWISKIKQLTREVSELQILIASEEERLLI